MAHAADPNPYTAPGEELIALEDVGPAKTCDYAGFWLRVAAHLLDHLLLAVALLAAFVLLGVVLGIAMVAAGQTAQPPVPAEQLQIRFLTGVLTLLTYLALAIAYLAYFVLMESSSRQATLGKIALGLKVTNIDGLRISPEQAAGRTLGRLVTNLTCLLGYVMVAFTARKQTLHDMMADTVVVKSRP